MFEELVESSAVKKRTNKPWTMVVSVVFQCVCVLILLLIPLIFTQALPTAGVLNTRLVAPPPSLAPPPPAPPAVQVKVVKPVPRLFTQGKLIAPTAIPKSVAVFKEAELPPEPPIGAGTGVFGGTPGGTGGVFGGFGDAGAAPAPPPPPPPPAPSPPPGPVAAIKVGGQVQSAKLVYSPNPVFPVIARQSRVSGQVVLHAIIGKNGSVDKLEVVSGNPVLTQSALDAVRQWRYRPTLLNGDPVEVDTTITVNFVLGN